MGIEPRDLGALEKAVNDAAGRASNLWISFVFFATLIAITTGTVTHRQLFLELPLKLPVLNVELPLMGYFFAVPLFFVVFHFYMLLQLDGLGAKIEDYNAVLREQHAHAADRRLLRQRLDSFIFAQVLVGARDRREGRIGALNGAVAWITMVGLPIGVLLLLQLMFLPYHHQGMTWWHRVCVLADLGLVWFFWGRVGGAEDAAPAGLVEEPKSPRIGGALAARIQMSPAIERIAAWSRAAMRWAIARTAVAAGALVVLFATLVAVYPTEWMHTAWFRAPFQPLTRLLIEGDLDEVVEARRPWLGSNRLLLADTDLGVEEKLVALAKTREVLDPSTKDKAADQARSVPRKVTLYLWDRDLSYANLLRADLRQVDLTRANMRRTNLIQARLEGANLWVAQLQGADLTAARLQGAYLRSAHLQGAYLRWAQLQGADLSWAQLQGARLGEAELQGADLSRAQLQGADLDKAKLQGAVLLGAQLQGANLAQAQLQGADLRRAQLLGAKLTRARVYRTSCPHSFADAAYWCLSGVGASIADVLRIDLRKTQRSQVESSENGTNLTGSAANEFRRFVEDVLRDVPAEVQQLVSRRLSVLEPKARTHEQDVQLAGRWQQERLRSLSPPRRVHIIWRLACGSNGAPHVARGLVRNGRLSDTGHYLHIIAAWMRSDKTDGSKCAGVKGFVDADWVQLTRVQFDALPKVAPAKHDAAQPSAGK